MDGACRRNDLPGLRPRFLDFFTFQHQNPRSGYGRGSNLDRGAGPWSFGPSIGMAFDTNAPQNSPRPSARVLWAGCVNRHAKRKACAKRMNRCFFARDPANFPHELGRRIQTSVCPSSPRPTLIEAARSAVHGHRKAFSCACMRTMGRPNTTSGNNGYF